MLFVIGYGDLFVFFIFLLTIVLLVRWRRPTDYPPGPHPLPLIGNFHNLITHDPLELFRGFRQKYGDIYSLALGNYWMVVVNGIENLKELLVRQGRKTVERPDLFQFRVFRNKGVISNSGPSRKHNRAFTLTCLKDLGFGRKSFEDNIRDEIKIFLQRIKETDQAPFDIASGIHTSISNVIMSITAGKRYKYDDPEFTKFIKLLDENLKDPCLKGPVNFVPSLANIPGDIFGAKKIQSKIDDMFNFFHREIDHHKQTFDETHIRDFIDAFLLEMKRRGRSDTLFTEEQLLIIIGDLFSAGTETSATTIAWALLYLLHNENTQLKMKAEIDDVVGRDSLPKMADKARLPYCSAVVLESTRLGNVVPLSLPHRVSEDIFHNNLRIPKGSFIVPSLDSVVHDENLFPDSFKFKPERFLDENNQLHGQENVLVFSLGKRVCPGEAIVHMELFLYLTSLVQQFKFGPPEGDEPPMVKGVLGITHSPSPYKLRAVPWD